MLGKRVFPEEHEVPPTVVSSGDARAVVHPTADSGRRVLAGLLASAAALLVLVGFAFAHLYNGLAPFVGAAAILAFWAAARLDARRLSEQNQRLAREVEAFADAAWELRESEERYRTLIDAHGDLIVRRAADGRVTFANPAMSEAVGCDLDALVGGRLVELPPDPGKRDVRLETPEGPRWYAAVDVRMRDETYTVARDITVRKESEQALLDVGRRAEAASQAKSRLLATVSHEFRTPLNGILGLTDLLAETALTPDQQTYVRAVHSSGEALLALVDDMLDFSKIEAGRLDLHPEPTDLESLLQDIAELLAARAHGRGIDLAVEVGRDLPAMVGVDAARLRQVLINLAGNGVKFTEAGGVTLSARRAQPTEAGHAAIVFSVSDTGPGIPAGEAERLFGEFEQMDGALTRRHGGAGLGLAISRRIVRRMGGDLIHEPRPTGGSVFSFLLDLPIAEPGNHPVVADLSGIGVLILAPEGAAPGVIARSIVAAGGAARAVASLQDAAALVGAAAAAGELHDVMLIDPRAVADPAAALATLREAAGDSMPAAVLIEPGRRGDVEGLRAAGFGAYLVRPVRRASVMRIVAELARSRGGGFAVDPGDAAPRKPAAPRRAATRIEVLLAEDNEINALLARAVLERLGHAVVEVRDGVAAVAKAKSERFPVILMDLHMPGLDGLEAAREIRAFERENGVAPAVILAVTADVLAETRIAAEAAGIDGIIEKPMTPETLRRALAEFTAPRAKTA